MTEYPLDLIRSRGQLDVAKPRRLLTELDSDRYSKHLVVFRPDGKAVDDLVQKASKAIPGLTDSSVVHRVLRHNPDCVIAIARKRKFNPAVPFGDGFFAFLPLNKAGLYQLAAGALDTGNPDLSLIARPDETPAGIYVWATFAPGPIAAGVALAMERIEVAPYAGVSLYSRPNTPEGFRFNENLGWKRGAKVGPIYAPHLYTFPRTAVSPPIYDSYRVVGATEPLIATLAHAPLTASFHARDVTQIDAESPRFEISDSAGISTQANWESGAGTLTAIASHRSSTIRRDYDLDNSPADLAYDPRDGERFHLSTFELRFQGEAGPLDYLVGGYVSRGLIVSRDSHSAGKAFDAYINGMTGGAIPLITGLPAGRNFPAGSGVLDVYRQRTDTFALFTHEIVKLTDTLSATLGVRYSKEEKTLAASIATSNPGCVQALSLHPGLVGVPANLAPLVCLPNFDPRYDGAYTTSRGDGSWSGTAALNQHLTDAFSAYVSYSRGYKSGGYQMERSGMSVTSPSLSQLAFNEETTDAYEAGIKGQSQDGAWRTSTALFHSTFSDYQFSYFTGLNRRTQNVPKLVTKGIEAEAAYRPIKELELTASGIYQEAIFGGSGFPAALVQLQGATAPLAPRWVGVAGVNYREAIPSVGVTAFGAMDVRWQSKSNVGSSASPSPNFFQGAYAVVGARLGIEAPERHWRVELWARNLFNQRAWALLSSTTLQPGSVSGFVTDPRAAGVTTTFTW